MVLVMENAKRFEPSPEQKRDSYIDNVIKEIEETGEPREIITECPGGIIVETIEPVLLSEGDGKKVEFLCTTKIEFVSINNKRIKVDLVDFIKNKRKVFLINFRYNLNRLGVSREEYKKDLKEGKAFQEQSDYIEGKGWQTFILYDDLSLMGNKISLLHEISHSHRAGTKEEKLSGLQEDLLMAYDQAKAEVKEGYRDTTPDDDEVLYKPNSNDPEDQDFLPVPREDFLAYHQAAAKEEKRAWDFALKILKEYRQKGLDLEAELPTQAELDFFIHSEHTYGLGDYEADLEKRQGGPEVDKIRGLYSPKMYKLREEVEKAKNVVPLH